MKLTELLEELDGTGLIYLDEDSVQEHLATLGWDLDKMFVNQENGEVEEIPQMPESGAGD